MIIKPVEEWDKSDEHGDVIKVDDVSITYIAFNGDCTDDAPQTLTIRTRNNGVARFLNIVTDEAGFSISGADDLKIIIEDFNNRAGIVKEEIEK